MKRTHRFLVPALLAAALSLALAASAAAEVRVGEAEGPADPTVPAEADIVHASAAYDSATGAMSFDLTTVAEPKAKNAKGEPSEAQMVVGLFTATAACSLEALLNKEVAYPVVQILAPYAEPENTKIQTAEGPNPPFTESGPATRTVANTKTAISGTVAALANRGFNCAAAVVLPSGQEEPVYLVFPIAAPLPPAPPAETPKEPEPPKTAPTSPPPAPAPASLSIARSKTLRAKAGKWTRVRITVTNTGGTSSTPGSLRVKGTRGVTVKPETQRLPLLTPGGSWTVTARVQLTKAARARSTLALTATAGGLTAQGSLVLKRAD
jgi:hypothetical protein